MYYFSVQLKSSDTLSRRMWIIFACVNVGVYACALAFCLIVGQGNRYLQNIHRYIHILMIAGLLVTVSLLKIGQKPSFWSLEVCTRVRLWWQKRYSWQFYLLDLDSRFQSTLIFSSLLLTGQICFLNANNRYSKKYRFNCDVILNSYKDY